MKHNKRRIYVTGNKRWRTCQWVTASIRRPRGRGCLEQYNSWALIFSVVDGNVSHVKLLLFVRRRNRHDFVVYRTRWVNALVHHVFGRRRRLTARTATALDHTLNKINESVDWSAGVITQLFTVSINQSIDKIGIALPHTNYGRGR